jgi:hypothetical protein
MEGGTSNTGIRPGQRVGALRHGLGADIDPQRVWSRQVVGYPTLPRPD